MNKSDLMLTQRTMALLGGQTPSTISRHIQAKKIQHLEMGNQRYLKYQISDVQRILKDIIAVNFPVNKKVHCFYNFKGGTGKTSLCFQVSTHLAVCGYKVLVVDADPQGNLSTSLGFDTSQSYLTLYDVIVNQAPVHSAIENIFPGYDCIPSNIACSRFDIELTLMSKREERIKLELERLKSEYDFIIFDTNPHISYVVRNISVFADIINIPCETQPYSLNALKVLFEDMNGFFKSMHMDRPECIIIPNKYEDRFGTSAEAMAILRQFYNEYLIPNFAVRKNEDFNKAAKLGLPLCFFAKKDSNALNDVIELMHTLIKRSSIHEETKKNNEAA